MTKPGCFTKNHVNIFIELVPHNSLLTYHQHNLFFTTPKWLIQLWSRLKHVSFVRLVWSLITLAKSVQFFPCHVSFMLSIDTFLLQLIKCYIKITCREFWNLMQYFSSFKVGFCGKIMNEQYTVALQTMSVWRSKLFWQVWQANAWPKQGQDQRGFTSIKMTPI